MLTVFYSTLGNIQPKYILNKVCHPNKKLTPNVMNEELTHICVGVVFSTSDVANVSMFEFAA